MKHLFKSDDGEYYACMACHHVWVLRASDRRVIDAFNEPAPKTSPPLHAR